MLSTPIGAWRRAYRTEISSKPKNEDVKKYNEAITAAERQDKMSKVRRDWNRSPIVVQVG